MQGRAFRCDTCGRIAFLTEDEVQEQDETVPPGGWIGLAAVPMEGSDWDIPKHFCGWPCVQGYINRLLTIPAPQMDSDAADEHLSLK
jgi:hypothetical protein